MLDIKKFAWRMRRPSILSLMLLVALVAVSMVAVPKAIKWKRNRNRYLMAAKSWGSLRRTVRQSGNNETDPTLKDWASVLERFYGSREKMYLEGAAKPWRELPWGHTAPNASREQVKALALRRQEIERGTKPQILIDELVRPRGAILPNSSLHLSR